MDFDDVFQGGDAEVKHMIVSFPKGSEAWYILRCEKHNLRFGSAHGAAKHLNGAPHGGMPKKHNIAVETLGIRVLNCDASKATKNNEAFLAWESREKEERQNIVRAGREKRGKIHRRRLASREISEVPATEEDSVGSCLEFSWEQWETWEGQADQEATSGSRGSTAFEGVTNPLAGEVYRGYWPVDRIWYAVVPLTIGDFSDIGILGSLRDTGLVQKVPPCYEQDSLSSHIFGWKNGFRDGEPKVNERWFPCLFLEPSLPPIPRKGTFDLADILEADVLSWVPARCLRPFDVNDVEILGHELATDWQTRMKNLVRDTAVDRRHESPASVIDLTTPAANATDGNLTEVDLDKGIQPSNTTLETNSRVVDRIDPEDGPQSHNKSTQPQDNGSHPTAGPKVVSTQAPDEMVAPSGSEVLDLSQDLDHSTVHRPMNTTALDPNVHIEGSTTITKHLKLPQMRGKRTPGNAKPKKKTRPEAAHSSNPAYAQAALAEQMRLLNESRASQNTIDNVSTKDMLDQTSGPQQGHGDGQSSQQNDTTTTQDPNPATHAPPRVTIPSVGHFQQVESPASGSPMSSSTNTAQVQITGVQEIPNEMQFSPVSQFHNYRMPQTQQLGPPDAEGGLSRGDHFSNQQFAGSSDSTWATPASSFSQMPTHYHSQTPAPYSNIHHPQQQQGNRPLDTQGPLYNADAITPAQKLHSFPSSLLQTPFSITDMEHQSVQTVYSDENAHSIYESAQYPSPVLSTREFGERTGYSTSLPQGQVSRNTFLHGLHTESHPQGMVTAPLETSFSPHPDEVFIKIERH
jgi:hypothetical protein